MLAGRSATWFPSEQAFHQSKPPSQQGTLHIGRLCQAAECRKEEGSTLRLTSAWQRGGGVTGLGLGLSFKSPWTYVSYLCSGLAGMQAGGLGGAGLGRTAQVRQLGLLRAMPHGGLTFRFMFRVSTHRLR